jgi:Tfp pilus assembly protein PilN
MPVRLVLVLCCWILLGAILLDLSRALMGRREAWSIQTELARLHQQDAQLIAELRQEGVDVSDTMFNQLPAEVELANQFLEKRIFSWTAFLTDLEGAIPPRLSISSIRLDARSSMVHLMGTATQLEDVTVLTAELQEHALFKDPVLAHHRVDPSGLVEFDVTLRYRRGGA